MEEEIDLRPYFEALLSNWLWIIGTAVAAAVVAFVVSSLIPPTYEATALVAVTEARQLVQFDPRFEAVEDGQPLLAYPELATSDELLQDLLVQLEEPIEDVETVERFRKLLTAESGSHPSLIRMSVRLDDPALAASVANQWAKLFVTSANAIYGDVGGDQVAFFEGQLAESRIELEAAEAALVEFQARDRSRIINNQLASLEREQAENLARQREIARIAEDVGSLRDQLENKTNGDSASFSDQLTVLLLQIKAFDAQGETPLQLQVDTASSLTGTGRAGQIEFLADLINTLEQMSGRIDERLIELEPQILDLQQKRQELEAESNRLTRDRAVADETYLALARKVEEERITSQDTSSGVRMASNAAVPVRPVSPRKTLYMFVATVLGGMMSVILVIGKQSR